MQVLADCGVQIGMHSGRMAASIQILGVSELRWTANCTAATPKLTHAY